jgi:hypothetical protein
MAGFLELDPVSLMVIVIQGRRRRSMAVCGLAVSGTVVKQLVA